MFRTQYLRHVSRLTELGTGFPPKGRSGKKLRLSYTFFCIGTYRLANGTKRPGIVASMEKLGRRRKLEVRGGFSHHLATSRVQ